VGIVISCVCDRVCLFVSCKCVRAKYEKDLNYQHQGGNNRHFTHTHTTILLLLWIMSGTTRVSRYQKGKTRKVKTNLDLLEQETVSGSDMC